MLLEKIVKILRVVRHKHFMHYYHFGEKVMIDAYVKIYNPGDISIGDGSHLQEGVWLNAVEIQKKRVLNIGRGCDIGRNSFITAKSSITLEDYVLLAPNVFISDHSHRYDDVTKPIIAQENTTPDPVVIGSGSWVGINCVILPGATIGKHCVIGANSVVNSSIPDFSVAVGSPARVIKKIKRTTNTI